MPVAASRLLRRSLATTWVGLALASAPGARANDVRGVRSGEITEKRHLVEVTLDRGHAELVVRRTIENGGASADEVAINIDLPDGAVATKLRSLGAFDEEPDWFSANLFDAELAKSKYLELSGVAARPPGGASLLLSWETPGQLSLVAAPILAGKQKIIEYTLKIPTHYADGRDQLTLPRAPAGGLQPDYIVRPARLGDAVVVGGIPMKDAAYLKLDETDEALSLGLRRADQPAIDGALAMVPFAKDRVLVRYRVEAAARLSIAPRGAYVVILIDTSRSVPTADVVAGLAAARAYLGHLPSAKVSLLTFDRQVHAVTEGFVTAARASAILEALPVMRHNGSRIDEALSRADALLASTPAHAPRRILALTDLLTRSEVDPEVIRVAPKSGAIVHAAVVRRGAVDLSRDDDHPWAKAVRATGGLVWQARGSSRADQRAEMLHVYEELVRPTRIDQLKLRANGIDPDTFSPPTMLEEGQSIEEIRIESKEVPKLEIEGALWTLPVRRVIGPDPQEGMLWSAQVFGSDVFDQLTPDEMKYLARRGQVVSPVTSLLAVEPEAGPWADGIDDRPGYGSTGGHSGSFGSGFGAGSGGRVSSSGVQQAWLNRAIARAFLGCGGAAGAGRITLETTRDEIADVPTLHINGQPSSSEQARCVAQAAWDLDLPPNLFTSPFARWTVSL